MKPIEKRPILLKNLGKPPVSGSFRGMRYYIDADGEKIMASVFPEPFSYKKTAPEYRIETEYEVTEEGFDAAIAWINRQYEQDQEKWKKASKLTILNAPSHVKETPHEAEKTPDGESN